MAERNDRMTNQERLCGICGHSDKGAKIIQPGWSVATDGEDLCGACTVAALKNQEERKAMYKLYEDLPSNPSLMDGDDWEPFSIRTED